MSKLNDPKASGSKVGSQNLQGRIAREVQATWRILDQCEHFCVEHNSYHSILRVTRISDAYPSTQALQEAHRWLLNVFKEFNRTKVVLVWDGRRGKLRNDPAFEEAMKQVLPAVTEGWREFISINNAPVVKVQFFRWSQERTARPIRVFNDEREAINYAIEVSATLP